MAIIDTVFMTKTAEKPYPLGTLFGAAHTYIAHIREYPPAIAQPLFCLGDILGLQMTWIMYEFACWNSNPQCLFDLARYFSTAPPPLQNIFEVAL